MSTTMSFTNQIIEKLGASSFSIGVSSIIYMLSAVFFARLGGSKWRLKVPIAIWIIISFLLLAMYCFLVPNVPSIGIIFILQVIPGIATGILFSFLTSEAMSGIQANISSTAMGLFQAIYAIGMTFFPIMVGYLSNKYSLTFAYYTLGFIAIFGGSIYVLLGSKFKKSEW